jgi:hypothetical protein
MTYRKNEARDDLRVKGGLGTAAGLASLAAGALFLHHETSPAGPSDPQD